MAWGFLMGFLVICGPNSKSTLMLHQSSAPNIVKALWLCSMFFFFFFFPFVNSMLILHIHRHIHRHQRTEGVVVYSFSTMVLWLVNHSYVFTVDMLWHTRSILRHNMHINCCCYTKHPYQTEKKRKTKNTLLFVYAWNNLHELHIQVMPRYERNKRTEFLKHLQTWIGIILIP